ncbi:hypothetical protein JW978_04565 [Candidatus Dojkabacteria bacterium]|nr:hypothetical protein [Candidatus Dojkabacteria bacterium]
MKRYFATFFLLLFVGLGSISAQTLGTLDEPARLRDIEPIVVQMIYVVWGVGTLGLTLILMKIGFDYMTSMGDAQKQQEIRAKGSKWLISVLIFYLAYPIILTFYQVTGIGEANEECYKDILTPGFHFFFADVCTDPQAGSDKYDINADCVNYTDEELASLVGRGNCCSSVKTISLPMNALISFPRGNETLNGDYAVTYQEDSGKLGFCEAIAADTCTVGPDCDPEYEVIVDPSGQPKVQEEKKSF